MRFVHIADLHLGKSLKEFDLFEDQKYILNQILEIIKEKAVDAVLIAGDVYDKAIRLFLVQSVGDWGKNIYH